MLKILGAIIAAVIPMNVFAVCDDDLKVFTNGVFYGFKYNDQIVVEPTFDNVKNMEKPFCDCLAAVQKDGQWGYVNKKGKVVIDFKYADAGLFSEGIAGVKLDLGWTLIDKSATNLCLKGEFVAVGTTSEGAISVAQLNDEGRVKAGYVDKSCKTLIAPSFDEAREFSNGLAPVRQEKRWALIDAKGQLATDWMVLSDPPLASSGLWIVAVAPPFHYRKFGLINEKGKMLIKPNYSRISTFDGKFVAAQKSWGGPWNHSASAFYDVKAEKWLTDFIFADVRGFSEGLAAAWPKDYDSLNMWGFINTKGKWVIPPTYYEVGDDFHNGVAKVLVNGRGWSRIDKKGNILD